MDKTGTITEGKPRVIDRAFRSRARLRQDVLAYRGCDRQSLHTSTRPSRGSSRRGVESNLRFGSELQSQNRTWSGSHYCGTTAYFVGNHRLAHELGVCSEKLETKLAEIEADAKSVVVVGHRPHADCRGEVLGVLTVGDAIRPNAAEAVRLSSRYRHSQGCHAERRQHPHRKRNRETGWHRRSSG